MRSKNPKERALCARKAGLVQQQTVLLVDDDSSLRKVLSALLSQGGIQTLEASCGEEALERLDSHAVDAMVSDLRMPGMSGMQLLAEVTRLRQENAQLADRALEHWHWSAAYAVLPPLCWLCGDMDWIGSSHNRPDRRNRHGWI